ncbi:MAG: copper-binding protein [Rhodospirillaceae bacterium]|nr:copper-binding protein [Rhodospirillaceae bacterium]
MKMNFLTLSAAVFLAFTLAACAAQEEKGHMEGEMKMDMGGHDEEITFGEVGMASMASRTITVNILDLAYDLKDLTVKDGETIRFIIVNKDEVEHEFTLGTAEMQAADRMMMEKQMEAGESMEMHEPNSVSVAELETAELVWKFKGPAKIEFACNVPGHYEAGMRGDVMILH